MKSDVVRDLDQTVKVREVLLDRGGEPMTLWIYRSTEIEPATKRPLVVIAAAGSPLIWGKALSEGDRPEHIPWAKRGYIVVAYSVDGAVSNWTDTRAQELGIRRFLRAHAGRDNATAALEFALANDVSIDRNRIFAVGHSSAATLALRFGAEDARVKAVVAFAPVTDVERRVHDALPLVESLVRDGRAILHASSPMTVAGLLRKKPVFLFHTEDDTAVPVDDTRKLAEAIKPTDSRTKVVIVPPGDYADPHYDPMIAEAMPAGMAWLEAAGL